MKTHCVNLDCTDEDEIKRLTVPVLVTIKVTKAVYIDYASSWEQYIFLIILKLLTRIMQNATFKIM